MTINNKQWSEIDSALRDNFPEDQIERKNGNIYINPDAIRNRLEKVLGANVSYNNFEVICNSSVGTYIKDGKEKPLYHIAVKIEIHITNDENNTIKVTTGVGAITKQYYGLNPKVSFDSSLKGAKTRAIRDASMALGIGAYLYHDFEEEEDEEPSDKFELRPEVKEGLHQIVSDYGISQEDVIDTIFTFINERGDTYDNEDNETALMYISKDREIFGAFVEFAQNHFKK